MAVLTAVSGLNGKLPAAFLLEVNGRRILLDLGEGPEPGVRPDTKALGQVDAIFLSHAHGDHIGAMDLWQSLGAPAVYASAATFAALPGQGIHLPASACNYLPLHGAAQILDLEVTLGRSGHALGGLWLHLNHGGGLIYMGDWSRESTILPFDPPPLADTVITDLSYCDRSESLDRQIADLAETVPAGAILPVPPLGRGPELALRLALKGRSVAVCPVIWDEIAALAQDPLGQLAPETRSALTKLLDGLTAAADAAEHQLIIAVELEHKASILADFAADGARHFVFTGHVAPQSFAAAILAKGRGRRASWNVHPTRACNIWLAAHVNARHILPAFGPISGAPALAAALGERLTLINPITL